MASSDIWLWHPSQTLNREPLPQDYRCCCGCCTSKCGFTFITAMTMLMLVLGSISLLFSLGADLDGFLAVGSSLAVMILLFIPSWKAVRTEKPKWMQFVLIIDVLYAIYQVSQLAYSIVQAYNKLSEATNEQEKQKANLEIGTAWFGVPFTLIVLAWSLCLSFSFYRYLRDKQLWIEQRGAPMTQVHLEAAQPIYPK